jgi:poly(A) polymerase
MTIDLTTEQERRLGEIVAVYPVADELAQRLDDLGHEAYLVGGTVRDTLLHGPVDPEQTPRDRDLDFATSAPPEVTEQALRGWADSVWLTGARFGTVSAVKDGWRLEITTFRSDAYQAGSRHPQVTFGSSITEDLSRRDFTINAMAVALPGPRFVDPFGGVADLHAKVLRTPLDPETSFGDDPLRMVRLARFAAVLGADVYARTAATTMADQIETVSRERIRDELDRLICGPHPRRGMDLLCETGLADHFLPEVPALHMERDPIHHHKDVYAHTMAVVEGCPRHDRILRLAALFHDIGKPDTREFHSDGRVTFYHHEVVGARMTRARMRELKYPKTDVEAVSHLVYLHLRFHGYSENEWSDSAVRRYVRDAGDDTQLARLNRLTRADVTTQNKDKARRLAAAMDDLEARIERLRGEEELAQIRPALDGNEIMAYLGMEPGPLVGEARQMLLEARLEQGPMTVDEAYRLLDAWAARRGLLADGG